MSNLIKIEREKRGWTQQELAEETGLSIRTIQRLESSANPPKGHSLKQLNVVFGSDFLEIKGIPSELKLINISVLSLLILPFGNIIFPFVLWNAHRKNIPETDELGKVIINFQIFWFLILIVLTTAFLFLQKLTDFNLIFWGLLSFVFINCIITIINAHRLNQEREDLIKSPLKFL